MKQLQLKSQNFKTILNDFRNWLDILGYAHSTVYGLPNHINELFYYLESRQCLQINQLNNQLIKNYYQELKNRPNTRRGGGLKNGFLNKQLQALYKFTDYLRQTKTHNLPALNIDWEPEQTKEIQPLTQLEIKQLYQGIYNVNQGSHLEPLNARDRAILTIFYACGLRRNEGYHLDINDIKWDKKLLHVRKGKAYKQRFVPLNPSSLKYLKDYVFDSRPQLAKKSSQTALLLSQRGRRMEGQSMALRLKALQQRTDNQILKEKNIYLHLLRHSIATHLLQNGLSLEKISRFLGHSSLESTQIYTHLMHKN